MLDFCQRLSDDSALRLAAPFMIGGHVNTFELIDLTSIWALFDALPLGHDECWRAYRSRLYDVFAAALRGEENDATRSLREAHGDKTLEALRRYSA